MKTLEYLGGLALAVIALVVVFVKAGRGGGQSGGQQAATIIKSASGGMAQVITALEGGS
jgi:hypothetical protein